MDVSIEYKKNLFKWFKYVRSIKLSLEAYIIRDHPVTSWTLHRKQPILPERVYYYVVAKNIWCPRLM